VCALEADWALYVSADDSSFGSLLLFFHSFFDAHFLQAFSIPYEGGVTFGESFYQRAWIFSA
jgi:hypothetical protein